MVPGSYSIWPLNGQTTGSMRYVSRAKGSAGPAALSRGSGAGCQSISGGVTPSVQTQAVARVPGCSWPGADSISSQSSAVNGRPSSRKGIDPSALPSWGTVTVSSVSQSVWIVSRMAPGSRA